MNKVDGGNRKFILIEMMDYADTVTAERVKRVINGYGEGKSTVEGTGGNFSFYELGETLLDGEKGETLLDGENLNDAVGIDKIREYVYYTEAKCHLDKTKIDEPFLLGVHMNTEYYFYYAKDNITTLLIQVLRHLAPVTIVDESHNAGSDLSVEMPNNLNPSLVLDLTATPRRNSNIISYVDARELKKENVVKLPVVVYNRTSRQSVIQDAIQLRGSIEQQAKAEEDAGGRYIRPIVLFQAQPKTNDDRETFDKIKTMLIEMGIPENQIAVKTKVDDLGKIDLMSRDYTVRYISTFNALKEGWDCPFAYILASLANKTSTVDVE